MINRILVFVCLMISTLPVYTQDVLGLKTIIQDIDNNGPISIHITDIDGDGFNDVLCGSDVDNKISWFKNLDGLGNFSAPVIISEAKIDIYNIHIEDINLDGHIDILAASRGENRCYWFKNIGLNGKFEAPKVINYNIRDAVNIFTSDLDGDGIKDIIISSGSGGEVVWHKNNNDPSNQFSEAIKIDEEINDFISIGTADLDNDGDFDIIGNSFSADALFWYENLDNASSFSSRHIISESLDGSYDFALSDFDNDGNIDIIANAYLDGTIQLFYNNSDGSFNNPLLINDDFVGLTGIDAADFDNDGDQDLAVCLGVSNGVISLLNIHNLGETFTPVEIISRSNLASIDVSSGDLDGDGYRDIVVASFSDDAIIWYKNDGTGSFLEGQPLNYSVSNPRKIQVVDVDKDGNLDLITLSNDDQMLAWHQNLGNNKGFGKQKFLTRDVKRGLDFVAADFDLDGNLDVISTYPSENKILGFSNISQDNLMINIEIDSSDGMPLSVIAEDLNQDGLLDIIISQEAADKIYCYKNLGNFQFSDRRLLINSIEGAVHLNTGDIDKDGDPDIIISSTEENTLYWAKNINSVGGFSFARIIDDQADGIQACRLIDLDGDGDLDIIASRWNATSLVWYENLNGQGNFSSPISLATNLNGATNIESADFDSDGDIDLMIDVYFSGTIVYLENLNGEGTMGSPIVVKSDLSRPSYITSADFDNDGDLDLFYIDEALLEVGYYENWLINDCYSNDFYVAYSQCSDGLLELTIQSDYPITNTDYQYIINNDLTGPITSSSTIISNIDPLDYVELEVFIINNQTGTCENTYNLNLPICEDNCILTEIINVSGVCNPNGTSYTATIDFTVDAPLSASFDLLIDQDYFGNYSYTSLPLELNNLPENSSGSNTITICDNDNDLCCISTEIASPCTCNFINITADIVECNTDNNTFYVLLDFTPINNGNGAFQIGGNLTTYGIYTEEDLPILIGPLMADDTNYDFLISDINANFCFNFIDIGAIDCNDQTVCSFNNLQLEPSACNDNGFFDLEFTFDAVAPINDSFQVILNGIEIQKFAHGENTYLLESLSGDCETIYTIDIQDLTYSQCQITSSLTTAVCCDITSCKITNLTVSNTECNADGNLNPTIQFEHQNTEGSKFQIIVNGTVISTNDYDQAEYSLGTLAGDCISSYDIQVVDITDSACSASATIDVVCCISNCGIDNLSFITQCNSDTDVHTINFDHPYPSNQNFQVKILNLPLGTFTYSELPIAVAIEIPQNASVPLTIIDTNNLCEYNQNVTISCNNECLFSDIKLTPTPCENELYDLTIEYSVVNPASNSFNLLINGFQFNTYNYSNPIILLENLAADCDTPISVQLIDTVEPNCTISATLEEAACCIEPECTIKSVQSLGINCITENSYTISLNLIHESNANNNFELYIDNVISGTYKYEQLPITLSDLITTEVSKTYTFCDETTACCDSIIIATPSCDPNCAINNISISEINCENGNSTFDFILDFDASGSLQEEFEFSINTQTIGNYNYNELPIQISGIAQNQSSYTLYVQDLNTLNCKDSLSLEMMPCLNNTMEILMNEVKIYQINHYLNITIPEGIKCDISLFDVTARELNIWNNLDSGLHQFQIPNYPTGIYIVRLNSESTFNNRKIFISSN